jgi:hypothetical protein
VNSRERNRELEVAGENEGAAGSRALQGLAAGTAANSEDTLRFAELAGVRPMIETYRLEKAGEAYARRMSGKAQFRVVLQIAIADGVRTTLDADEMRSEQRRRPIHREELLLRQTGYPGEAHERGFSG